MLGIAASAFLDRVEYLATTALGMVARVSISMSCLRAGFEDATTSLASDVRTTRYFKRL